MMSALPTARPGLLHGARPERRRDASDPPVPMRWPLLREAWGPLVRRDFDALHPGIEAAAAAVCGLSDDALRAYVARLGLRLRAQGLQTDLAVEAFGTILHVTERLLGLRLHRTQLLAGWSMLSGSIVEMATGEGKTLSAVLPAITAASAGIPVHVITVNDYLVERDADNLGPLYDFFGLDVGVATDQQTDGERRAAYAKPVVYCTNKQLVFDYLRDLQSGARAGLVGALRNLTAQESVPPLLRGLCFAIVDEADSVLVDDARNPLILARPKPLDRSTTTEAAIALGIARTLHEGADFQLQPESRSVWLTPTGLDALRALAERLDGVWQFERYRNELVQQALRALHLLRLDRDYLVRDGKIALIDESTGRSLPDRKLQHGLHQLLELKEKLDATEENEVLAALSFQRFFPRFHRLAGMSGTVREVAGELTSVYDVGVVRIPPNRPSQHHQLPAVVSADLNAQLGRLIADVRHYQQAGRPLLLGARAVGLSERISDALTAAGIEHQLLNARQDADEAAIVARAGALGAVTVATNMAGRGTDIPLAPGVADRGGLHVISLQLNESRRIDRQLYGRAARQGDPGSSQLMISLADDLLVTMVPAPALQGIAHLLKRWPRIGTLLATRAARYAQWRCERQHAQERNRVHKSNHELDRQLAVTGDRE